MAETPRGNVLNNTLEVGPDYRIPRRRVCPICRQSDEIGIQLSGLHLTACDRCEIAFDPDVPPSILADPVALMPPLDGLEEFLCADTLTLGPNYFLPRPLRTTTA